MEIGMHRFLPFCVGSVALAAIALAQTPAAPGVDAELQRTFRQADADGDGALTRDEAIRAKLSLSKKETFDGVDKDHNGLVTLFELGDALQSRLRAWAADAGVDRDGDGELSEDEATSEPAISAVFGGADADHDGKLSRDEYESFSRRNLYGNVDLPSVVPSIFEKKF
jgi:Ca2+-binding EF-hand superfamily protein